jgi:hypothetical protein
VSQASQDPDFDLAEGSHQLAETLRIDSNDFRKEITNTTLKSIQNIQKNSAVENIKVVDCSSSVEQSFFSGETLRDFFKRRN